MKLETFQGEFRCKFFFDLNPIAFSYTPIVYQRVYKLFPCISCSQHLYFLSSLYCCIFWPHICCILNVYSVYGMYIAHLRTFRHLQSRIPALYSRSIALGDSIIEKLGLCPKEEMQGQVMKVQRRLEAIFTCKERVSRLAFILRLYTLKSIIN